MSFYRDLFGYEVSAVSGTDEFRYFTFRAAGTATELGGMMDSRRWVAPEAARWDVYWHVEDVAAVADRATSLGAVLRQGPDSTPYGVLALLADPAGAEFKLRAPAGARPGRFDPPLGAARNRRVVSRPGRAGLHGQRRRRHGRYTRPSRSGGTQRS